jgi:hypothetical protein
MVAFGCGCVYNVQNNTNPREGANHGTIRHDRRGGRFGRMCGGSRAVRADLSLVQRVASRFKRVGTLSALRAYALRKLRGVGPFLSGSLMKRIEEARLFAVSANCISVARVPWLQSRQG